MEKLKRYIIFIIGLYINSFGVSLITKATLGTSPISSIPVRAESQLPVQPGTVYHFFQHFSHRAAADHFTAKLQDGARPSDPGIHCLRILHRLQHVSAVGSGTGSICMEDDLPAAGLSDPGIRSVHGSAGRRGHAPGRILRAVHRVPVAHGLRDHQDLL